MKQLKVQHEFLDQQQEKHNAYVGAGFKLVSTRHNKDTIVRKYTK